LLEVGGAEKIGQSAVALGTISATILTSARSWVEKGIIVKLPGTGMYGVGPTKPAPGILAAAQAFESRNGDGA
jgi:hypothetical protein